MKRTGISLIALWLLTAGGCAVEPIERKTNILAPLIGADSTELDATSAEEVRRLRLVATNLVAALVQLPETRPGATTLQVRRPVSAFGNLIVRALEDAGFGLQRVDADQGRNNVSYSQRLARTESGPVEDFTLSVGRVALSREYSRQGENIYPSSLLQLSGTDSASDIVLHDDVFREQGDIGIAYISGVRRENAAAASDVVRTIEVRPEDPLPIAHRTASEHVLASARRHDFKSASSRPPPDPRRYVRKDRLVLLLDNATALYLGRKNKRLVRDLVERVGSADLVVIKACHDANGDRQAAISLAMRIEQEIVGLGVTASAVRLAPCIGASYRHVANDAHIEPVEIIHYLRR